MGEAWQWRGLSRISSLLCPATSWMRNWIQILAPTTCSCFFSPSVDRGVPMRLCLAQMSELGEGEWGDQQQGSMAVRVSGARASHSSGFG